MENNCVGELPATPSHLDLDDFPDSERQMHLKALQILNSHPSTPEKNLEKTDLTADGLGECQMLSDAEMQVVAKSAVFLQYRINKLYCDTLLAKAKIPAQRLIISSRFSWFVEQLDLFLSQCDTEDCILGNETLSEEEKEIQLKRLAQSWIHPFSQETWKAFWKEKIEPMLWDAHE
jgi:hypothetical protein